MLGQISSLVSTCPSPPLTYLVKRSEFCVANRELERIFIFILSFSFLSAESSLSALQDTKQEEVPAQRRLQSKQTDKGHALKYTPRTLLTIS